jgi:hypothetical protein
LAQEAASPSDRLDGRGAFIESFHRVIEGKKVADNRLGNSNFHHRTLAEVEKRVQIKKSQRTLYPPRVK